MGPQLTALAAGIVATMTLVVASAALRPANAGPVRPARWRLRQRLYVHRRAIIAIGVAVTVLTTTRMVVLAVAAVAVVWLVPTLIASTRSRAREQQMLEAVHVWLLQLRTVLTAGSGLEQALVETATLHPAHSPLAPAARRLANSVPLLGPIRALRGFAIEVDNHVCDAAVTVLTNALARQNVGVAAALDGLLEWAEQDVRQQRDIDARLQTVRTQRWMIIGIFAGLAAYFTAANPTLMAVYATPVGQAVLAAILGVAGLCVWSLERMARPRRPPQFFARQELS